MEYWKNILLEDILNEEWREIKGYEGRYSVSNFGRVKSLCRWVPAGLNNGKREIKERILMQQLSLSGYFTVHLRGAAKKNGYPRVSRLVCLAFVLNEFNKPYVNHLDSNKKNNSASNLEWCTQSENILHAFRSGNKKPNKTMLGVIGSANTRSMPIIQMNIDGTPIKVWPSMSQPQRDLGYYQSNIFKACIGQIKTAYGYKWKYF